ncbi:MAG TPA: class II aldolase/adducin family protein [Niabella sp.]|nr:class II aldolase/adducin family protein [Niabella sp.]
MDSKILDTKWLHPKDQIVIAISRIYNRGLTTTSGGNLSILDENGDLWITPSGVDKGSLNASDIMCVTKEGQIIGKHKPSSEFPFHRAIYNQRPDIKAIIHAHPPALVSFSIVRQIPDTNVTYQTKHVCGPIGYADYELPGSQKLGDKIAEEFAKGYMAIIMENHGTVLGGSDLADAFERFETLEFCAKTLLSAKIIGEPHCLTDEEIQYYIAQRPNDFPEMETVAHPSDERALRSEICNIVHRACAHGFMFSAIGTVSARWRGNDFLITPTEISRWDMTPADIVQIKDKQSEPGKQASHLARLHQKIYEQNPDINCIIFSQPTNLMAFGATKKYFDVRTIPESWIFLQDVASLPFEVFLEEKTDELLDQLKKGAKAVLIQNGSFMVTGKSLLQTFDYLEVAEFSAKSLVMGAPMGNMVPINDAQVEELRGAFLK